MLSCPIESSEEWKNILAEVNGNRERALELWEERGFAENENLNEAPQDDEAETVVEEEESEDETDFTKLVQRIKLYLNKQLDDLSKKKIKNQTYKTKRLEALIDQLNTLEGVEVINEFINDAYEKSKKAKYRFDTILKNKDTLDTKELINELTAINDFANGYSILDEISAKDLNDFFSSAGRTGKNEADYSPQDKLSYALEVRNAVRSKFVTEAIPLMAKTLTYYKSDTSDEKVRAQIKDTQKRIEAITADQSLSSKAKERKLNQEQAILDKLNSFLINEESLIETLTLASKDEDALDFLIAPLISSEDSALALFAKMIKSAFENARQQDILTRDELVKDFEKYASKTSVSRDNVEDFNEGIYEVLDYTYKDEKGEVQTIKRKAFVQKFDINKFNKAKEDFYNKIGPKPLLSETPTKDEKAALKGWQAAQGEWYRNNTQPKSKEERAKIIKEKAKERNAGIITQEEYDEWRDSVYYTYNGKEYFMKELSEPSNAYLNSNWTKLYDSNNKPLNAKGEYHQELTKKYFEAQEKLPVSQRPGYILPSIEKTDKERLRTNGVLKTVKNIAAESVKVKSYDIEYRLANLSEEGVKFLPIYYTQNMDANDVSSDLIRSVLMFNSMANRYEAMNNLNGEISMFKTIIGKRQVVETNSKGQPILDAFAKKLGYTEFVRQNGESYSQKHVDAFIDMVVYGEMQKAEELFGFSLSKVTNSLTAFSAYTSIAADILKGVANNLQGNIQVIIEANAGEFFTKKNLAKAKATYMKNAGSFLADFGKSSPQNLLSQLTELYDAIQGDFKDKYGRNVSGSLAGKLFRTDTLFFNQHFGEHEIQVSTMLALMDATIVTDKSGKSMTLLEAHQLYGSKPGDLEKNTDFTEKRRQDFQNTLHALNKRMQGVYNDFDKGTAQRYSLGRLGLMYRKHLVPGYMRRFKKYSMDQELGSPTEGFYRTFATTFLRDLIDYKLQINKAWSTYTPFQKAQIKRTIAEITIILSITAMIMMLTALGDEPDEEAVKKSYAYNFLMYELVRMRSETASYISPTDAYRVVKSPSAMTSTLERAIKFGNQILPWNITEDYQRRSGIWEKGDNKAWAYFLKLAGFSGYNITPEQAVKSFEGTLAK